MLEILTENHVLYLRAYENIVEKYNIDSPMSKEIAARNLDVIRDLMYKWATNLSEHEGRKYYIHALKTLADINMMYENDGGLAKVPSREEFFNGKQK